MPFPPHVAKNVKEARALYDLVQEQGRSGFAGIVQGEHALARARRATSDGERDPYGEGSFPRPKPLGRGGTRERPNEMKRVAYYKGCLASLSAKELDSSTQALAPRVGLELEELESVTCCGAGDIHEAEPDYYLHLNARILVVRRRDRLRHAAHGLQRLHAEPAPGELAAVGDAELRARVNENLASVGVAGVRARRRRAPPALGARRGRGLRAR